MRQTTIRQWCTDLLPRLTLLSVLLGAILPGPPSVAEEFTLTRVQAAIEKRVSDPEALATRGCRGETIYGIRMIPLSYRGRRYLPFWIEASRRLDKAVALTEAIGRAGDDGLLPPDYHLNAINRLLTDIRRLQPPETGASPDSWADLDLLLTDAFLLLGNHLAVGRVDPGTMQANRTIDPGRVALLPSLRRAAATGDVEAALAGLRPSNKGYATLRRALVRLREVAAGGGWPAMDERQPLQPGDRGVAVEALRRRLTVSGDIDPLLTESDGSFFDTSLTAAVKRFQRRHGLNADGVVRQDTYAQLNVPAQRRIHQAALNLERWRWLPHQLEDRYIIVNTAAFSLKAVDHGRVGLKMRVVVGRPARRSPVFSSTMTYLVVNPSWSVPPTIAVEDMLPRIQEDVAFLARRGIHVFKNWRPEAPELDPTTIDWRAYHAGRFPFRLQQDPGPENALGRVKFMFPNDYAVYLHDTPDRDLFNHVQRDLSSGCIRVEAPIALADFVLAGNARWSRRALSAAVEEGKTRTIRLDHPVPVHLLYMTAWTDASEVTHFQNDFYHQDDALARALGIDSTPASIRR